MSESIDSPNSERWLREAAGSCLRDFWHSYEFSQGDPVTQKLLMLTVRNYYASVPGMLPMPAEVMSMAQDNVESLTLPRRHKAIQADSMRGDFRSRFNDFRTCVDNPDHTFKISKGEAIQLRLQGLPTVFPPDRVERLEMLVHLIGQRDYHFSGDDHPRLILTGVAPRRYEPDLYESHLRTYILGGADTNSAAFNAVFAEARALLVAQYPNTGLELYQQAWEQDHPDATEGYYPESFLAEVAARS